MRSVSMTAVFEAIGLKIVFTTMPCSSFPSHSPARERSFLNAAPAQVVARIGAAVIEAKRINRIVRLRRFMSAWTERAQKTIAASKEAVPELRVAGGGGGDFDDGIRELAHRTDKDLHDGAVKLRVGAALELSEGFQRAAAFFVRTIAGDRVVGIGHRDDAGAERDGFGRESVGIPGAVEKFVVMQNHLANAGQRSKRIQNLGAEFYVGLHGFPFVRIKRAALV